MALILYLTTVTSSRETKSQQNEMTRVLDTCGQPYETVDIAVDNTLREEMRLKCSNPIALPPQLFRGEKHLGETSLKANETVINEAPGTTVMCLTILMCSFCHYILNN
ncbi:SH3 domain-binding glutamic acid-rich-like protein 3 isoform 1-T1 [Mantella aurantiaca]